MTASTYLVFGDEPLGITLDYTIFGRGRNTNAPGIDSSESENGLNDACFD